MLVKVLAGSGSAFTSTCQTADSLVMFDFLPKDLDGNQRIEKKIPCHLQRASISMAPLPGNFQPKLI